MRCKACDKLLTDVETCVKDPETGVYLDLCQYCRTESVDACFDNTLWREYRKDHKVSKKH